MQAKQWLPYLVLILALSACGQVMTRVPPLPASPSATATLELIFLATSTSLPVPSLIPVATEPAHTPTPTPTPIIHAVEPGDTLVAIAAHYRTTSNAIQLANPGLRPELLQIGQKIIIPAGEAQAGEPFLLLESTPLPLEFRGLGFYHTPVGGLWALGEVFNPTQYLADNVQVAVALLSQWGTPLADQKGWVARDLIPPGESAPFGILFTDPPADPGGHLITLVSAETATRPSGVLTQLTSSEVQGGPAGAYFRVTGMIQNEGNQDMQEIIVLVTLYDDENRVTGFRQQKLPGPLPAGTAVQFDVRLSPGGPGTSHFVVTLAGREADFWD